MKARDKSYIERIKEELRFIEKSLKGVGEAAFLKDDILQHAISMSLITIGECANHLSAAFKESHPNIEWVQIVAVRNIAAHGYWQLNMKQIWKATEEDIPVLRTFFDGIHLG